MTSTATNKTVLDRYLRLPIPDNKCQVMYVWIDGSGENLRSKSRTINFIPKSPTELPIWNFDGSSTGQAEGSNSDVYLHPIALYCAAVIAVSSSGFITEVSTTTSSLRNAGREGGSPGCGMPLEEVVVSGGTSLTLTSPHFPAAYDYRTKCGWTVKPTSRNVALTMTCETFDLEKADSAGQCLDFLKVQGTKYCGGSIPVVISATNLTRFKVIFKTNRSGNYGGFHCTVRATNPNTEHCSCGVRGQSRSSPSEERVEEGEFPWQAAMVETKAPTTPFCGASVIHESWVLTSATCVQRIKYNKYNYEVVVGGNNLDEASSGQVRVPIRKVFIHARYVPGASGSENDVALVQLKEALTFRSGGPIPVCLPRPHTHYSTHAAIFTGWGAEKGRSAVVRKVVVRMLAAADCPRRYQDHVPPALLCALPANTTTRNLCQADLGGPLVVEGRGEKGVKGKYVQVGVAAYADGCEEQGGDVRLPGVYTDLTPYLRWINETVGLDDTCH